MIDVVIGIELVTVGSVTMNEEEYEKYDRQLRKEQMSHKYAKPYAQIDEEDFHKLLRAWHNNNGIQGFADYFEWGGYSRVYHYYSKESGESVRNLIIKDYYSKGSGEFRDNYVNEWWYVWKSGSLNEVYFRSDGSIYHWLMSIINREKIYDN